MPRGWQYWAGGSSSPCAVSQSRDQGVQLLTGSLFTSQAEPLTHSKTPWVQTFTVSYTMLLQKSISEHILDEINASLGTRTENCGGSFKILISRGAIWALGKCWEPCHFENPALKWTNGCWVAVQAKLSTVCWHFPLLPNSKNSNTFNGPTNNSRKK